MTTRRAAVTGSAILDMVMVVLVIAVSSYMIYSFFSDSQDTLQRCITGTCVKNTDACLPEGATTGRPCGGEEANAHCVQSYDDIPDNCIVSPTTSDNDEQQEQREQEQQPIQNDDLDGETQENAESETGEAYIEVREADSTDHKGEGQTTIMLEESENHPIHIWSRGIQQATCSVTILRNSVAEEGLPQAQESCGHTLETVNKPDNHVITMSLNTTRYVQDDAEYALQVIAEAQGSQVASIEKRLQIS